MKKKLIAMLMCLTMTVGMLAGCGSSEPKAEQSAEKTEAADESESKKVTGELQELRVAVIPVMSSLPVQYIIDQGWDVENGFKIEKVVFSSGAPMGEALVSNLWDVGIMSAAGVFTAANYDGLCIADTSDSIGKNGVGIFARPDSEVVQVKGSNPTYPNLYGDAESVKGKTILCPTGTLSQMHVSKWLEKIGLTESDVKLVHMEFAQAYQAFLSGQGDLVALNTPFCFDIYGECEGVIDVADSTELEVELYDMIFANKKTYDDKYDAIKRFIYLVYEAGSELEADPELKIEKLKEWYSLNGSEIDDLTVEKEATKKLFTLDDIANMEQKVGKTLITTAEFYAECGKIESDKLPVVQENINDEIVKELLEER